ncbi:vitamin B12 dependent-methionine synthase activation domain-containing protein [Solibaculum mannosilyticum]|uniref:vitamin B12 dependent-methionine synthase activation domain-containing protein n=1 Tax=Solibaculum mannosilyticum TaxID=2780922 RepID=UPI0007A8DF4C|nr:Vitamin B12 dependent methionine synthase, activation domain [Eubacteriaceae bacterium CHKCI005]
MDWNAIDRREILRYLGYGQKDADASTWESIQQCLHELENAVRPSSRWAVFDVVHGSQGIELPQCGMVLEGQSIASHLQGCDKAVLLAATLSAQADRLIRSTQACDMAKGLIMDCCATAAIERVCDEAEEDIRSSLTGKYFTFRFSPGYGDLPITLQKKFLAVLDAPRKIGLCATDTSLLTPRKSVTAVIGVSDRPVAPQRRGCGACNLNKTCQFRKRGAHCGV